LKSQTELYARKKEYDIYRCSFCGLLFVHPLPKDTGAIYSAGYFTGAEQGFGYVDYDEDKEAMKDVFIKYLELIEGYKPRKGKILDIGAATGYFAGLAGQRGWEACGIEVSDYAAGLGRRKGLDIRTGTVMDSDFENNSFEAVTLWDVLEHLPDPAGDLAKIHNLLKSDGIIIANTPDSASLYAKLMGRSWYSLIPPEHLFLFSPKSLKIFLERQNFEPIKFLKIGKNFTVQYIFQIMASWLKLKPLYRVSRSLKNTFLSRIAIPLDLRDNMLVIARKINAKNP